MSKNASKSLPPLPSASDLVAIGKILRPHGVRGEMRTLILTDFPERFFETDEVFFVSPNQKIVKRFELQSARFHANWILLKFTGIDSPEEVAEYRHWLITVPQDQLVELEEGEYWHFQLEGLQVEDADGHPIGTLKEVVETPGHDLYAVLPPHGKEILIPAVKEYVLNVDLDQGKMIVKVPLIAE
ncbi:MAG: ribosome maturation factor RimM [bacterium]|nr:ribosome maturation factor RimM [bacterium]